MIYGHKLKNDSLTHLKEGMTTAECCDRPCTAVNHFL